MADLQTLTSKIDELVIVNANLMGQLVAERSNVANLVQVAGETKAALIAQQGPGVDFQPLIDKLQGVIDSQGATSVAVTAEQNAVQAAATSDAP